MRNCIIILLTIFIACACTDTTKQTERTRFSSETEARQKAKEILENIDGCVKFIRVGGWKNPNLNITLTLTNNNENIFRFGEAKILILDQSSNVVYEFDTDTVRNRKGDFRIPPGQTRDLTYDFPFSARASLHKMNVAVLDEDLHHWYFIGKNELERLQENIQTKRWTCRLAGITGGTYGDPNVPLSTVTVTPDARYMYSIIPKVNIATVPTP